jgi:hypothetical protein
MDLTFTIYKQERSYTYLNTQIFPLNVNSLPFLLLSDLNLFKAYDKVHYVFYGD